MRGGHVHDQLGAYVLGALEPREEAAIAAHLELCDECAVAYEELAALPGLLDCAVVGRPPASRQE